VSSRYVISFCYSDKSRRSKNKARGEILGVKSFRGQRRNRGYVRHGKQRNGRPFRERPFICHKENRGTGLAEVKGVDARSVIHVAMKNGSLPKEPCVGGPTQSLVDPFMTCDPGRRVSRRHRWKASVSSAVVSGDSEDTSWGTAPITGLGRPDVTREKLGDWGGEN
jgi:hypothetical protein